jgi:hypothetical protein
MTPIADDSNDPLNRRNFARSLAATAAATAATSLDTNTNADDADTGKTTPLPTNKPDPEPPPPAALLLETVRQLYPHKQLDSKDVLQGVYSEFQSDLARSRRLSQFPLKNSDEPGFLFAAFQSPR